MSARKTTKPVKPAGYLIAVMIIGMLCGAGFAMIENTNVLGGLSSRAGIVIAFALAAFLGIACVWLGARWMKSIDEAAQEAHKWSWYWGGSIGMAVGMVLIFMGALPQAANIRFESWYGERTDPVAYMATGAVALLGLMVLGYLVAWALWWFQRR